MSPEPHIIDARGLVCPEPIHKAELAFRALAPGALAMVLATDQASPIDFEFWCLQHGHAYLGCTDTGAWLEISLCKGWPKEQ
jgi:tRNA 2-thiouridine synthesizing protein A